MIVRVRTRDGTEKVEVPDNATVKQLRQQLETQFKVPFADQTLSLDQKLLVAPEVAGFKDMTDVNKALKSLNIGHGSIIFFRYSVEREVTKNPVSAETKAFGSKMTIQDMIAKQTRIERQELPKCQSVSFDGNAANVFQAYIGAAMGFSKQRCGFLYGTCSEEGVVQVHVIYEPPQEGTVDHVVIIRNEDEENRVAFIMEQLGLKRVGWIFSVSVQHERHFPLSEKEVRAMAALQAEAPDDFFVTAVVAQVPDEEGNPTVHFEAFQCSQQCVKLHRDGWLTDSDDPKFVATTCGPPQCLRTEKEPVIVAGRDTRKIEAEFLYNVVPILDHEGPLATAFPVENRLTGQTADDLKRVLQAAKGKPYVMKIADFHLLLFLSGGMFELHDLALMCEAVKNMAPVPEGFCMLIDAIAGIH